MNGEPLAPEHGHPLRVVVPGFAGIRSPKWLARITVQDRPSDNPMQADDYKLFPPDVTAETADPAHGITIEAMPLNSAICEPARGAALKAGRHAIRGYAIASDRAVARVDVSTDGGRSWAQARIDRDADAPYAWTFWEIERELTAASTNLRCGPGTPPARPSRPPPTTPGTTRATSAPHGTGCGSPWPDHHAQSKAVAARPEIAISKAAIPMVRMRGIIGISAWARRARIARSRHAAPRTRQARSRST